MKVLFVCSGNSGDVSILAKRQANSLEEKKISVNFFIIKGKGIKGYLKNIRPLHKKLTSNSYDIVHAHYSFSAFLASLAGSKHLVVSLMGSDLMTMNFYVFLIRFFSSFFNWKSIIVKSRSMEETLKLKNVNIIPNGVDTKLFRPMDLKECRSKLGWNAQKKHILFASDPGRPEKNYQLVKESVDKMKDPGIELHVLVDICPEEVPIYINASDSIILTSKREGSPNIIKEAMACNCPVIATKVGDIEWLFGNEAGHFLTTYNHEKIIQSLYMSISFREGNLFTNGRGRIFELGLNSDKVAERLIKEYRKILTN
jgi:glycosyltransferase involved in cell wall biosynthesis